MNRSTLLVIALLAAAALSVSVLAQDGVVVIQAADHDEFGTYLTDGEGNSLYLFANDSDGESACDDQCTQNWPPVTGEAAAGEGVAGSLLGTIERENGTSQITYNGMPLYYFVQDENAGDTSGHGASGVWHLVSNYGSAIAAGAAPSAVDYGPVDTVQTARHEEYGTYLTDGEGRSLYLFANDSDGESACDDQCAQNWPPVTGDPNAGQGVSDSLLGTTERDDGTMQVTYSGRPLNYFGQDEDAGDVKGHGANDVWFLVSNYGSAIEAPERSEVEPERADDEPIRGGHMAPREPAVNIPDDVMASGRRIYSNLCVSCHGEEGEGAVGPAFADSDRLANDNLVIRQIVRGGAFMPPFGKQLDDQQVAAVGTYIRNTWGNSFGPIEPEEVADMR